MLTTLLPLPLLFPSFPGEIQTTTRKGLAGGTNVPVDAPEGLGLALCV